MSDLAAPRASTCRHPVGACALLGTACAAVGLAARGLADLSATEIVALAIAVGASYAAAALLLHWLVSRAQTAAGRVGVGLLATAGGALSLLAGVRLLLPPDGSGATTVLPTLLVIAACLAPWIVPLAGVAPPTPRLDLAGLLPPAPAGPGTAVSLTAQLQPHFLFNTLHSVSTLMHFDVEAADRMLARLAELLRRTTAALPSPEITLAEELALLEPYLDILRIRFADRLVVTVEVEPAARGEFVPTLVLQPLVENAVRHGIARSERGEVRVGAHVREGHLLLTVRNTGPGLPPEWRPASEGVGLSNTRARLNCLYGSDHLLAIASQRGGGLAVTLRIPLRTREHERSAVGRPVDTAVAGGDRR